MHLAGIELHADVRINLYGFAEKSLYSEGCLAIPLRFASSTYFISTLPSYYSNYTNVLAFTPIFQNTVVNINLKLVSGSITYGNRQYEQ